MLKMRYCVKAINALMERLVQDKEISHVRQSFITYMSQSLQRLPEAQYQLAVKRMTVILHEMQRPIPPTPSSSCTTSSLSTSTHTHLLPAVPPLQATDSASALLAIADI
jgi:hypothetical protein